MDKPVERPSPVAFPDDLTESEAKALTAIDRMIANPPENSRVFWLNRSMSGYLLERYNIGNRPEKPAKIGTYSKAMSAREWRLTGDTIKFSSRGLLRDGQNRLLAEVASGVPFQTHIVFGIPDEFFTVMDQGKNRDGSDLLAIAGVKDAVVVAAAIRWAHMYETGTVPLRTTLEPPFVFKLWEDRYQGKIEHLAPLGRAIWRMHRWPAGFIAGSLYYLSTIDKADAEEFGRAMANNNFSGKLQSLDRMRIKLGGIADVSQGRIHDTVRAALLLIAWNLFRGGRKGSQKDFKWDTNQPFPVAK